MSYTPTCNQFMVDQQGAEAFPYPAGWVDVIQSSPTVSSYNLAAARTAMGLNATQGLYVIFSADGPFWTNFNTTAALPSGNTTTGGASEFSPNQRYLDHTVTAISVISSADQNISMSFYR